MGLLQTLINVEKNVKRILKTSMLPLAITEDLDFSPVRVTDFFPTGGTIREPAFICGPGYWSKSNYVIME